jgi:hypothetical protein
MASCVKFEMTINILGESRTGDSMKSVLLMLLMMSVSFAYGAGKRSVKSEKKKAMYYVDPSGINDKQLENFKKHIMRVHRMLPAKFKEIQRINISFKKFRKKKNSVHMAHYSYMNDRVTVNSNIIPEEGNDHRLVKTLIHEFTHVLEKKVLKLHKDLKFLYLSGWHKRGIIFNRTKRRNLMKQRSPDPYEFSHPRETLAVNMEYFLTDPEFQCRRPLLYEYLQREIEHTPFPGFACGDMREVPMVINQRVVWTKLDPTRLYEVHYLLADEGEAIMSRFGHSMMRLVFCAPHRDIMSKECLKDVEHHVILSYRANVTDAFIDYWGGLFGKYPSQLFLMTLSEVITEYNKSEFRNLLSIPIQLTDIEKSRVVSQVLEEVWTYRGRYRFITQNCATETLDFLKAIMDNKELLESKILTPKGVYKKMKELELVNDEPVFAEDRKQYGYYFESKQAKYKRIFEKIAHHFEHHEDLKEFLEESTADERREVFLRLQDEKAPVSEVASLYVMEKQIEYMKGQGFLKLATKVIIKGKDVPGFVKDIFNKKIEVKDISEMDENQGYGIPTETEAAMMKLFVKKPAADNAQEKALEEWLQKRFSSVFEESGKMKENLEIFKQYVVTN